MQVTLVHVHVKPAYVQDFIAATRANHEGSIREPGNRRFDFIQSVEDPTRFVLIEAYGAKEDIAAHKETEHYRRWRDTVAAWMAEPRTATVYSGLCVP